MISEDLRQQLIERNQKRVLAECHVCGTEVERSQPRAAYATCDECARQIKRETDRAYYRRKMLDPEWAKARSARHCQRHADRRAVESV